MKKNPTALSRRHFLRAAGVTLGLPALESFGAAAGEAPRRLVAIQTNQGIMPHLFFPETDGAAYEPSHYLKTLEPLRENFTVFSGLSHPGVDGGHANEVCFLTGAPHPAGAGFRNSISVDQFAAERLGSETRFESLVVGVGNSGDRGMSYNRSGVGIPPEADPAKLYRALFVEGSAEEVDLRLNDLRAGRSLLDTVRKRAKRMEKTVTAADRDRLDQYFTSIRELEGQLLQAESWARKPKPKVALAEPPPMKDASVLISRLRATYDIVRLALETDSTRVVTIYVQPLGVISEIAGVQNETHALTHHGNRPEMIAELQKIEEAQFLALRDFLTGLDSVKEPAGSLLDLSAVLYGTCMGNANGHSNANWPLLLAGGGFRHGRHLAFDTQRNEPISKLFVSLLQRLGVETDEFSSGKGTLRGLEMA
jgi:hypothetical protein